MLRIASILTLFMLSLSVSVFAADPDVIYLSDTNDGGGTDGLSGIYQVVLDNQFNTATLSPIPYGGNGLVPYNHVDALAAEPDGSILWLINSGSKEAAGQQNLLVKYTIATDSLDEIGQILLGGATAIGDTDQAATSPNGTLYLTTKPGGELYSVNKDNAAPTLVGTIPNFANGGDIAFGQDGTFYIVVNNDGLYELDITTPSDIKATLIGSVTGNYTGLAVRNSGSGDVIASNGQTDTIRQLDTSDATVVQDYPMAPFNHVYGDMTTGPLVLCTKTIGYWKNHDWPGTVTINGFSIDQDFGSCKAGEKKPCEGILWNAKGKDFSMLYAQLIAAKLNTNNVIGIPIIDDAEKFLAVNAPSLPAFNDPIPKSLKGAYSGHVEALSTFNENNHCDDE